MRRLILIAACIGLAACNKAPKTDPNAKAAGGEVLPGTVSDAMLNLDGTTAEAPLAPHAAAKGADKSGKASPKTAASSSAAAGDAEEAPKADPEKPAAAAEE